jgi:hypothetical protein
LSGEGSSSLCCAHGYDKRKKRIVAVQLSRRKLFHSHPDEKRHGGEHVSVPTHSNIASGEDLSE